MISISIMTLHVQGHERLIHIQKTTSLSRMHIKNNKLCIVVCLKTRCR